MRDDAHDDRECISLLKDIYAKAAFSGQGVAEIGGAGFARVEAPPRDYRG